MRKILIVLFVFVLPVSVFAQLISVEQLQKEIKSNKNLVILGIEKAGGKIPNSRDVEYRLVRKDDNVPPAKLFESLMKREGVNQKSKVVIVEEGKGFGTFHPAARLYWTFKYFGFDNVYILEGGLQEWEDMGGAISKERPKRIKNGNFKVKIERDEIYASSDEVEESMGKKPIVDARPFAQYIGAAKPPIAKQKGHVDGAKSAPLDTYFKQGTHFHDKEVLKKHFVNLGIELEDENIVYCNTGSFAAVGWFVMSEILGKKTKLYDASMKEWDGPVATKLQN